MSQLAFDLELDAEPLYFPAGVTPDRCRKCHRPVKGRHSLAASGRTDLGNYADCDDCVRETAAARREAAPFYDCGIHKVAYQLGEHTHVCLNNVCEFCGEQEPNDFLIRLNHCPEAPISVRDQMCMKQRTALHRLADSA